MYAVHAVAHIFQHLWLDRHIFSTISPILAALDLSTGDFMTISGPEIAVMAANFS
jgi:hypothetical protein